MDQHGSDIRAEMDRLKKLVQKNRKALIEAAIKAEDLNGLISEATRLRVHLGSQPKVRELEELSKALRKAFLGITP